MVADGAGGHVLLRIQGRKAGSPEAVQGFAANLSAKTDELLEEWAERARADLSNDTPRPPRTGVEKERERLRAIREGRARLVDGEWVYP